jgi:predicted alpha-1,2-mannosidase
VANGHKLERLHYDPPTAYNQRTHMMFSLRHLFLLAAFLVTNLAPGQSVAYRAVDPFIGTGPDGHTFPGAASPFGMVQLSPDTQIRNFRESYKWAAGYRYDDTTILGFSHTHFSGAGHSDLGDFLIQPIAGDVRLQPGDPAVPNSGYRSRFHHATEHAEPGYYAVTLDDYDIRAELTATPRVGVHRYTFPAGKPAHLLMDLRSSIYNYPGKALWSSLRIRRDGTITGMRITRGWAPARQLFFAMRLSVPLTGHTFYDKESDAVEYRGFAPPGGSPLTGQPTSAQAIQGRGLMAVFDLGQTVEPVVVRVALSPTSEDNAIANLQAEAPAPDFDAIRGQIRSVWEHELASVDFHASPGMEKSLYTALYHALLAPSLAMDTDGSYRGPDNAVHHADGFHFVSSLSLWDTYRAEQPLMTLLEPPARTTDLVRSMLASQQESPFGILPIWQFQGLETWCMIGYHAVPEIADAYMKGIGGFDANAALDAMVASATYAPYGHLDEYMKLGYVPVNDDSEAASKTVEYAFDDWTIARMAVKLRRNDVAAIFEKRARNWQNTFNPQATPGGGFIQPRLVNGQFRIPFDPAQAGAKSGFTEGNSWQYSFYQPQDEARMIDLLGGDKQFIAQLDATFDAKVDPKQYADIDDIAGMIGQYIHGNEPSHHMAYLYNFAGAPWRTQARLKQIINSQYRPAPDGLVGNDDLGQMSAWLLFTSLGFYPVAPASNQYVIGRPFVDSATLHLPNGRQFRITADHLSNQNTYVQQITLNGRPLTRSYLTHEEILAGGELHFVMNSTPNTIWATGKDARPYSQSTAATP